MSLELLNILYLTFKKSFSFSIVAPLGVYLWFAVKHLKAISGWIELVVE